jgi:tetratricopeptide (TPR) repeat protein
MTFIDSRHGRATRPIPGHVLRHRFAFHRAAIAWAAVSCCLYHPTKAQADQVITQAQNLTDVTVVDLLDGNLHVRRADGKTLQTPILQVERLVIDSASGMSDLNDAERYAADQEYDRAITRYERALRMASGFWTQLIRIRLFQICDRAGKHDKSISYYLDLAADSAVVGAKLFPQSMTDWPTNDLRRVAQRLETGQRKSELDPMLLDLFTYAVLARSNPAKAEKLVADIVAGSVPSEIATEPVYQAYCAACRACLEQGKAAETLQAVDRAIESCPETSMPQFLILKGEALLAQAKEPKGRLRAALAFMRVPVHFPDDPQAPMGLFQTALVYESIGNPKKAGILMAECKQHRLVSSELRQRADEALKRFSSAGSP